MMEKCPQCGMRVERLPGLDLLLVPQKDYFLEGAGDTRAVCLRTRQVLVGGFVTARQGACLASRIHACPEVKPMQQDLFEKGADGGEEAGSGKPGTA